MSGPTEPRRVAMVGRANAGKTSLVLAITGFGQRPVNFPGSSVERVEAAGVHRDSPFILIDLPGIASLSALSRDEGVTLDFLRGTGDPADHGQRPPDVICVVADASKLSVELNLLKGLAALGRPLVLALNKVDIAEAAGRPVDIDALQLELGIPVIATRGRDGMGTDALMDALLGPIQAPPTALATLEPDAIAGRCVSRNANHANPKITFTERFDAIALHPFLGLPLMLALFAGVFQLIFVGADPLIGLVEAAQGALSNLATGAIPPGPIQSLVVDGLIAGVGAIFVFIPQIVILITAIALLEASGYMARAVFLLDRIMRSVGLSGRSFVPMVSSFACAVPGILAARTIEDERDRIATIVVAPLMSCSARMPVYIILIGAFFPLKHAGLILFSLYALGIITAFIVAAILRRTALRGGISTLAMELPIYQRPTLKGILSQVGTAVRQFLVLAGTTIFAASVIIWALSYYPRSEQIGADAAEARAAISTQLQQNALTEAAAAGATAQIDAYERGAYLEQSYLASAGKTVQPLFAPMGFDWRVTVGVLASFPARELIVPTLGILYNLGDVDPGAYDFAFLDSPDAPDDQGLRAVLRSAQNADGSRSLSPAVALAIMVFFALCSQCAATLAVIRRETRSWRWPVFTFTYMTVLAWVVGVLVYQIGSAMGLA